MASNIGRRRFIPVLLIGFCGISIFSGILVWNYIDLHLVPIQPTSQGLFPKSADWIFTADEEIISTPVITNSLAILRISDSILAIDSRNGSRVWETQSFIPDYPKSNITIAPIITGDRVIAPEENSTISAFSLQTGERLWKSQQIQANPEDLDLFNIESYSVYGNKVFVARRSWALSAYDLINGDQLWEVDVPNRSSPIVKADLRCVYLAIDTSVQCIDPLTGKQIWEKDLDGTIGNLFLDGNTLYVSVLNGASRLVALDLDTLNSKWSINTNDLPEEKIYSLFLEGNHLYAGGRKLYKISKENGEIFWATDEIGWLETPLVFESLVFIRNKYHDLYMIDSHTGKVVGNLRVKYNSPMTFDPDRSPTLYQDLLLVPFGDNRAFAYRIQ